MRPPVLTEFSDAEKKIAQYQLGFASRLRKSQYFVVEKTKTSGTSYFVASFVMIYANNE